MISLAATPILAVIGVVGWWMFLVSQDREQDARHRLGHSFLLRSQAAEEAGRRYPDSALYAALSIGFEGLGKPTESKDPEWFPYLSADEYPDLTGEIREKIRSMPGHRPVWSAKAEFPISTLQISAHGRYVLVGGDGRCQRWDFAASLPSVSHYETTAVTLSHDGRSLLMGGATGAVLVNEEGTAPLTTEPAIAIACSPCGTRITGARPGGTLFRIKPDEKTTGIAGGDVTSLRCSPDGSLLAVALGDETVRFFFTDSLEEHALDGLPGHGSTSVAFHPQSETIAIGSTDGRLEIRTLHDGRRLAAFPPGGFSTSRINALDFSPDGSRIASAHADGLVRLWRLEGDDHVLEASLNGHGAPVTRVAFFPCGRLIASGGEDGSLIAWSLDSESPERDLFGLVENGWYRFHPETGNLEASLGAGFYELPDDSLIAAWQTGDPVTPGTRYTVTNPYLAFLLGVEGEPLVEPFRREIESALDSGHHSLARGLAKRADYPHPDLDPAPSPPTPGESFFNGNGEEMTWCPPGTFTMGSDDGPPFALSHRVTLTSAFWIARHEVTRADYRALAGSAAIDESKPDHPVTGISWFDARNYCRALTARDRIRGLLPAVWRYDLPTEAQWEYACRAGSTSGWSFGDDPAELHRFGNYNDAAGSFGEFADPDHDDGFRFTAPVGVFESNAWGLFDMHGNVFEWCRDAMDPANPDYPGRPVTDPYRNQGQLRVTRGGGFDAMAPECQSNYRDATHPQLPSPNLGFRIVLIPETD